jgi:hypothetical protein
MKAFSKVAIFVTLAICLGFTVQNRWSNDAWKGIIRSDGYGYYSYLPCVFIYHKFDYDRVLKEEQKYNPAAYCVTATVFQNKVTDKCFPGVALLLAPFFLIGYLLSYLLGYGTGGYEFLFQASVSIGALFYLALGLVFLRKLMKELGISDFIIGLTIILIVFATNLFYYSTMEVSMSHVYSFGITAIFLFYAKKSIHDFRLKNLIWMIVTMSILLLICPTNMFSIAFIPFLAGNYKDTSGFILNFFKNKKVLILLFLGACILFIQFLVSYLQTGHFFVWSYPGESFDFKHPHFLDILFSYRKGWFLYTPLMLVAVLGGLVALFRQNKFRFFCALFFFLFVTYVLSSWWSWWYGGGFSIRAFVDYYSIFALLLALFLNSMVSLWLKFATGVLVFLCMWLNLIQTSQYIGLIIPYDGMDKEKYWKVFLKNNGLYCCLFERPDTLQYRYMDTLSFGNNTNNYKRHDSLDSYIFSHPVLLYSENQNSPEFKIKGSRLPSIKNLGVYVKLWTVMTNFDNDAKMIAYVRDKNGNITFWANKSLQGFVFEKNKRTKAYYIFLLPEIKPDDNVVVFINDSEGSVYFDNMEVQFCTPL